MRSDLQQFLSESDLDALWIIGSGQENPYMDYLTGSAMLVHADLFLLNNNGVLFHSPMERDAAENTGFDKSAYSNYLTQELLKESKNDPVLRQILLYEAIIRELGLMDKRIGVCGKIEFGKFFDVFSGLQDRLRNLEFSSTAAVEILDRAMITKDEEEVSRIRYLGKVTEIIADNLVSFLRSYKIKGKKLIKSADEYLTIADAKRMVNLWAAENNCRVALDLILSIGRDAGVPHNPGNGDDVFELGKTIVMDIVLGELHGGYQHDFTRTWCLGYASPEIEAAYEQVKEIQIKVIEDLKVDTPFVQYQNQVCDYFEAKGHKTVRNTRSITEGYVHSLGHGIGLRVHEKPFCPTGSKDIIEKGNIFTIEPGLYYPEKGFGIRIEDTIYAAPNGHFEIFNNSPKELVINLD